jgi:hypothetical protein
MGGPGVALELSGNPRKRAPRGGPGVVDFLHQRKEVVQHMSHSSYGTLEVAGR